MDCGCALSKRARKGGTNERASEGKHDRGFKLSEAATVFVPPKIHKGLKQLLHDELRALKPAGMRDLTRKKGSNKKGTKVGNN